MTPLTQQNLFLACQQLVPAGRKTVVLRDERRAVALKRFRPLVALADRRGHQALGLPVAVAAHQPASRPTREAGIIAVPPFKEEKRPIFLRFGQIVSRVATLTPQVALLTLLRLL